MKENVDLYIELFKIIAKIQTIENILRVNMSRIHSSFLNNEERRIVLRRLRCMNLILPRRYL